VSWRCAGYARCSIMVMAPGLRSEGLRSTWLMS
jgi:hypothetical protein